MLPQNGISNHNNSMDSSMSSFNMDPSQAKQMAALLSTNQLRMRSSAQPSMSVSGVNSAPFLGGTTPDSHTTVTSQMSNNNPNPLFDPNMSQQTRNALKQRSMGFLRGLANFMNNRNTPLPPALTGQATPNYDPSISQFKGLDIPDVGVLRIFGKDVDLFKLWGLVFQQGGSSAITNNNGWISLLPHFELPEEAPQPHGNKPANVAHTLQSLYHMILALFEEAYRKNMLSQHQKAGAASRAGGIAQPPPTPSRPNPNQSMQPPPPPGSQFPRGSSMGVPPTPNVPQSPMFSQTPQTPQQTSGAMPSIDPSQNLLPEVHGSSTDASVADLDPQTLKRKAETEDAEGKRARQKTEGPDANSSAGPPSTMPAPRIRQQMPSRRKIEYVPFAREVDTYGGRDLRQLEADLATLPQRRPIRDINDWGVIDIDSLTLSVRSRLSTELSYALTTLTLLSTMKGQTPGSGFPIFQCWDLFEEVLDLLEDSAFNGMDDPFLPEPLHSDKPIATHRALVNSVREIEECQPFAGLARRQGSKDSSLGPRQRPGDYILAIMNILRNLVNIPDNIPHLAKHSRMIDVVLRVCCVAQQSGSLSAASSALSASDLVAVRKDVLHMLSSIASMISFSEPSSPSKATLRMATRIFQLIASYLVDPTEALGPIQSVAPAGAPFDPGARPPSLPDMALELFTRIGQSDNNRQVFARAVPQPWLWRFFVALIHRLPILDIDFQLMMREHWLSYLEKNIMAIYSVAFLASPELKLKVKLDRTLAFKSVMLRMVKRLLLAGNQMSHQQRGWFMICVRRAVETMKVVDDGEDAFDTSKSVVPTMSFGMGYGEIGDGAGDRGTGLLGGNRDVAWELLMMRDVGGDEVVFGELESLARVE